MEEENARLKTELAATKTLAEEANKLAAKARLDAVVMKMEIGMLRKTLDKELKAQEDAKASTEENEEQIRTAVESLLSKFSGSSLYNFVVAADLLKVVLIV